MRGLLALIIPFLLVEVFLFTRHMYPLAVGLFFAVVLFGILISRKK